MSEGQWAALDVLTTMPAFASLAKDMEKNSEDW
jgi:dynein heavy chain